MSQESREGVITPPGECQQNKQGDVCRALHCLLSIYCKVVWNIVVVTSAEEEVMRSGRCVILSVILPVFMVTAKVIIETYM